jgi:type IV secretion system protein VirB6
MTCPAIATGSGFLSGMMAHVDCQARTIGSYGYGALADPRSPAFVALTALLTIFIALHGVKLLFGAFEGRAGIIGDVVKVGIVLTLATSWPAWRTIGYDLILDGPAEFAGSIGLASGLAGPSLDLVTRLQAVDDGIVAITSYGTGRLTGGVAAGNDLGDSFKGVALADQFAFGMGRAAFLVGTLVPFGIFRLGAGILLALAPLMAGLLLFGGTNGIFHGWARGLAFCAFGSLVHILVQGVELALIEPWLQSVLDGRQSGAFTPSAPTELFVLSLAFAGISLGLLLLCARFAFFQAWGHFANFRRVSVEREERQREADRQGRPSDAPLPSRAEVIADLVGETVRRERGALQIGGAAERRLILTAGRAVSSHSPLEGYGEQVQAGGMDGKRKIGRTSASAQLRDRKS